MLAISLTIAPFFIRKNLCFKGVIVAFALLDLTIITSILFLDIFPVMYINDVGSTLFKNVSEYVISLAMIGAIVLLYRNLTFCRMDTYIEFCRNDQSIVVTRYVPSSVPDLTHEGLHSYSLPILNSPYSISFWFAASHMLILPVL